ncbi:hypothetical protein N431DRAFT_327486 [Stipitochalara longipes BDJ]|nr:hypothetical protein N431DRAFT_327486 [Stipitochalara longipes BDJ]
MPDFKGIAKGGWHPKGKDGTSKESWRGDNKGINQVAGWIGKGKDPNATKAHDHVSRPLSTLKDPAAFGPPPKNVNYHGGAALPNQITPDTGGWGAPLSKEEIYAKQQAEEEAQREAEEAAKPKGPPLPFRADTTGLSTANLPPPPGRRDGTDGRTPPPATKPKPGLPPRLPPRQNSNPTSPPPAYSTASSEPDPHKGILNQASMSRLSAAGVSVPEFGIAQARQPIPPPGPASPSRASAASPTNSPQLNELQSRFSRLSSSTSAKAESPSEGTTFAQKQAALKTASAFRADPSSVSLSDARTAASTANNFRERHGEQVKSGFQTANKLNSRYGIADKVGSYGGVSSTQAPEPVNPQIEMRDNTFGGPTNGGPNSTALGKKKPPPPPVKRAGLGGPTTSQEPTPPPIPLSSKPKPQVVVKDLRGHQRRDHPLTSQPTSSHEAKDYDLDLKSLWFARSPVSFPPPTMNRDGKIFYSSSSGWSSSGVRKTHTFTAHVRNTVTLASSKIHLTWDASNPAVTVKAQQRHYPPPRRLSQTELESYHQKYSNAVAEWSESQMGTQVGNGECWTLANNALKAIAAGCSSHGQEPCMASQGVVHGYLMYSYVPSSTKPEPQGKVKDAGVARGDVIQLYKAHFKFPDGGQAWAGNPDHTAVITGVEPDSVLKVVQQNSGGKKIVQIGKYNMAHIVSGEVRIFRAVGESWIGNLDPTW